MFNTLVLNMSLKYAVVSSSAVCMYMCDLQTLLPSVSVVCLIVE